MSQQHDETTRAAVLAALLQGQSVSQIARDFNISRPTIQRWRDASGYAGHVAVASQEKQDRIATLVSSLLEANLETLRVHTELARDKAWTHRQSAAELATFDGVLSDKTFRLLEALERGAAIESEQSA